MQGLTLSCNCCESRREQNFKPLSYLDSGLGRGDKGIPKESALSAQFPLDSAVLLPLPSPHSSSPMPIFSTASLHCHKKTETRWLLWRFVYIHTHTHTHTHTPRRAWPRLSNGDEWQFFLGCVFFFLLICSYPITSSFLPTFSCYFFLLPDNTSYWPVLFLNISFASRNHSLRTELLNLHPLICNMRKIII